MSDVGNLSWETEREDLEKYFEQFGAVRALRFPLHLTNPGGG
jgi:RNA recognition motif-containing protein